VAVVEVRCPECGSRAVVKYGRQANGAQRYRCNNRHCERRIFLLRYHNTGRLPEVKQQVVDMALNGSGIRDTTRVLGVSPTTVNFEFPPARRATRSQNSGSKEMGTFQSPWDKAL
jgi:insertion element IS1 protein InsB